MRIIFVTFLFSLFFIANSQEKLKNAALCKEHNLKFDASSWNKLKSGFGTATVIRDDKEAEKYFSLDQLKQIRNMTDFNKQKVLVFAWGGSRTDQVRYQINDEKQITFSFKWGTGRNLHRHTKVFVISKNVDYKMKRADGRPPTR